jgi:Ca2+-binding RTX toxin-like protein
MTKIASIERVSLSTSGQQITGNCYLGTASVISSNGKNIVFVTEADNFGIGTISDLGIVVKNLETEAVQKISVSVPSNASTFNLYNYALPFFLPQGNEVVFQSSTSLLPNDKSGGDAYDIYARDISSNALRLLSSNSAGISPFNTQSFQASISADGTKMAFTGSGPLVAKDVNNDDDIYYKDLVTGSLSIISTRADGSIVYDDSYKPSISADGTKVAFLGYSNILVPNDPIALDVFVKDITTGAVTLASKPLGAHIEYYSYSPTISPDGTKVLFHSYLSNLVVGDTNGRADLFMTDLATGVISRIATEVDGFTGSSSRGGGRSAVSSFSPDGTKVLFQSSASDLVAGDTNNKSDIFLKDLITGKVTLISQSMEGAQGDLGATTPSFSADGTQIIFESKSNNLVAGDTNSTQDIFIVTLDECEPINGGVSDDLLSGDGCNDTMNGYQGNDTMMGGAGNDTMIGWSGHDALYGEEGNDSIVGGSGEDTLSGGEGNDYLSGGNGNDSVIGGSGNDSFLGGIGEDTLMGFDGNDVINGEAGNDSLYGDTGSDTLKGGDGGDYLNGGLGRDVMIGGTGIDTFIFYDRAETVETGADRIKNFIVGEDKLYLVGLGYHSLASASDHVEGTLRLAYSAVSNITYIRDNYSTFEIALEEGDYRLTLSDSNFVW